MNLCSHPSLESLKYITAKFFLIKGTLDSNINYTQELKLLSKLSPDLMESLDLFWKSLIEMKVPYHKSNQEIVVFDFFNNIEHVYNKVK